MNQKYHEIWNFKKERIRRLSKILKEDYQTSNGIDWKRMSEDLRIGIIESRRAFLPCYAPSMKTIFSYPNLSKPARDYCLAHEFAHAILEHKKYFSITQYYQGEAEADYLAEMLTGNKKEKAFEGNLEFKLIRACFWILQKTKIVKNPTIDELESIKQRAR